ncbi:hypothetical protein B0H10DRAFT_2037625 [Mycena sp. CBHHK59/15]|nr:hypothetical protein B0H10DRAFT_2037625 [Mycena sp. CBHHK59/15]
MPPVYMAFYPLSMASAHLLASLFASAYVGSLYVAKNARLRFSKVSKKSASRTGRGRQAPEGSRDDPAVIRARLSVVTFVSIFTCGVVYAIVAASTAPADAGSPRDNWPPSFLSCLQTPLLFLGPLYASYLGSSLPFQANYSMQNDFVDVFQTWVGLRNYIWGPLTEEIVFRACVLSVYAMAGAGRGKMIAFAPMAFGLAHVHHAWETYNQYGRTAAALKRAVLTTLFQTGYTTLFGAHTSFLFLRTSSLAPPFTAHVFCNIMGVPQMSSEIAIHPERKSAIITAYVLGIVLFFGTLWPWTSVEGGGLYWRAAGDFWRVAGRMPWSSS